MSEIEREKDTLMAPEGEEQAPERELVPVVSRYRKFRPYVFVMVVIAFVHLGYAYHIQRTCVRLNMDLAGENWEEAMERLVRMERKALPYTARTYYYDENPEARRRAGMTLLRSLENLVETAPRPDPDTLRIWEEWKQEIQISEDALLDQILMEAERAVDPRIEQILPEMRPWLRWQESIRNAAENEMITRALAEEDPVCRDLAEQMIQITGFEHGIERRRYRRYQNMNRLLAMLRENPESEEVRRQVFHEWSDHETVGEFGLPVLVGLLQTGETKEIQEAAAYVLRGMLAAAYRADDRDEMIRLVGHRRLRILLSMLVDPDAEHLDVKGLLTFSPNIPDAFVAGIRGQLAQAETEAELQARIDRWYDIYTSLEEGQRAILRSEEVRAIMPGGDA